MKRLWYALPMLPIVFALIVFTAISGENTVTVISAFGLFVLVFVSACALFVVSTFAFVFFVWSIFWLVDFADKKINGGKK